MASRRSFITGLLAASAVPQVTWADAGNPSLIAAAKLPNGQFSLFGLDNNGQDVFEIPLPARGHAAAVHPTKPEAIAFARRPGRFALVINCLSGEMEQRLDAPKGRHFYGHGTFISNGEILCTTENNIETGQGILGLWSRGTNYRRIGEIPSGGIGPHEVKTLGDDKTVVVANGGIRTHPDSGRQKLNIADMRPNISLVNFGTKEYQFFELDRALHKNSIRHLDVGPNDNIAFGMQWQGDQTDIVPLVGSINAATGIKLISAPTQQWAQLKNYVGSIAIAPQSGAICVTAPRAGIAHIYSNDKLVNLIRRADVSGVAAFTNSFALSDGNGSVFKTSAKNTTLLRKADRNWDNHMVAINSSEVFKN
jgi:hypothetical protein